MEIFREIGADHPTAQFESGERPVTREDVWTEGAVIAKRYRLAKLVGEGGMGRVFEALDCIEGRRVALKLVSFLGEESAQIEARFEREIQVLDTLRGSAFVKVLDHGVTSGGGYIAMELLEGETLSMRLSREGRLDIATTLGVVRGVADALGEAHDMAIVHRDLKPSNIFLERDAARVRLLDFGIAKDLWSTSTITAAGHVLGSPHYVSPEQARAIPVDHRTDLFSLGVILYRCLTGSRPFEGNLGRLLTRIVEDDPSPPSRLVPSLPASIDVFFVKALAKRPDDRFQDAKQMREAFEEACAELFSDRMSATTAPPPLRARTITSDRTRVASTSYEEYARRASEGARISAHPTVELDLAAAAALPSAPPAPRMRAPSEAIEIVAPPPPAAPSRPPRTSTFPYELVVGALMLAVIASIVLFVALR